MNYEISYILKTSSLDSFQLYVYAKAVQVKVGLQLRSKTKGKVIYLLDFYSS